MKIDDSDATSWTASQVLAGQELITGLMMDRTHGIMFVSTGSGSHVRVGLLPDRFDTEKRVVDEALESAGLGGIATYERSTGLHING